MTAIPIHAKPAPGDPPLPKTGTQHTHVKHGVVKIVRQWRRRHKAIIEDATGQRHISDFCFLTPIPPSETL